MKNLRNFFNFFLIFSILSLTLPISLASVGGISVVDDTVFDKEGKNWLLEWNSMYSDYVEAEFSSSDLESETGYDAERGFTLKIDSGDEYGLYSFTHQKTIPLVVIKELPLLLWGGYSDSEVSNFITNNCLDLDDSGNAKRLYTWSVVGEIRRVICFGKESNLGEVHRIYKKVGVFSADWIFKPNGKPEERFTIDNDHNTQADYTKKIGNDLFIRWRGSFTTGETLPEYSGYLVAKYTYSASSRYFINYEDAYDDWRVIAQGDGIELLCDYYQGLISKDSAERTLNLPAEEIFLWRSDSFYLPYTTFQEDGGTFQYKLGDTVYIPDFNVWIDGDYYVKIIVPEGIPNIVSFTVPDMEEQTSGNAVVKVRNDGDDEGDFMLQVSCTDNVQATGTSTYIRGIDPGETQTKNINLVSPAISSGNEYSCEITAKDVNSGKTDTAIAYGQLSVRPECEGNSQTAKLVNNVWHIYQCNSNTGDYTTLIKVCSAGDYVEYHTDTNTYSCESTAPNQYCGDGTCGGDEHCGNCKKDCSCPEGYTCKNKVCIEGEGGFDLDFDTIMVIIIVIALAITVFLIMSKSKKGKNKGFGRKK